MRIVVALGGNALLQRGQKADAQPQIDNVVAAVDALGQIAEEHDLVLTHGNGPQVGILALQSANDETLTVPYPFDSIGAMTQGMIGYWMLEALENRLPHRSVASIVNQTLVLASDPAFDNPTKFVGAVYSEEEARQLSQERGWVMKEDGQYYRRVVASPMPQRIVEIKVIRTLVENGIIVICSGGGGIPVARDENGRLVGIEAVIDKDRSGAVLAESLDADFFMILTDVPAVFDNYGTPDQTEIRQATPAQLRSKGFAAGSMGPKVEAACTFVELTGGVAAIGRLEDAEKILKGEAGTIITPSGSYMSPALSVNSLPRAS
ncbi:Carbamate kinase 1 [Corynebacterium kutscheri]|uniref:Carbamate kinase n=1 Tax=Corynebacterium kutscheri TaxID=35755 RepID=A0A0F6TC06_9CORY|nr:carbamate kinase [Corynebacterium kutscheri]AKE40344.1 carbamate kinase [Corynebacterium kutscheri]VEH05392.1 Carbamate kinase 1 [Corynebacterium kutscheri]VEH10738.1 Carbamate kinase 1 [Corynebacterium kutscheri]VEH80782.1 Carbamate kinase 1 [Corynebacterium kutscheri]